MSEWEIIEEVKENASIKVIGVGGGGGNAVQHMVESGIEGAEFISVNTDKQALDKNDASTKLILGMDITDGLGAGANPAIGSFLWQDSHLHPDHLLYPFPELI